MSALAAGNPDGEDEAQKATRLAARAARFNKSAPGKRNKELEDSRAKERQAFEAQGLINSGKTQLGDAVDMKGTCERMCSPFELETRNIRMEVHPFERGPDDKLDPNKAVAAYTRSDAGAGHGSSAILPSDLRTPATLVKTLDYLFSEVMPLPPTSTSSKSIDRKALGHSAGFIRDRTRAIRKEFAMQSTWGHQEAIASFERIARWHILCIRELQEETGFNSDMHIDSAELGRCFTSLRHLYNDRREETGLEMPCPNEPEMRAYMLIFDLANKSVSIPTSELPAVILDDPLVKLAWEIRKSAQRNFDSQKEGSKLNAELGSNLITRFTRLLKQRNVPFLLSCMVEVRLRDMRRSALRALTRTYPRLKTDPIRLNDEDQVVERKMLLLENLNKILGCEEQDEEETAWQDVVPSSRDPMDESVNVVSKFELEVWPDRDEPVGALINLGAVFDDNQDAPYTRRWKLITDKRKGLSLVDIVNGQSGVLMSSIGASTTRAARPTPAPSASSFSSSASAFAPADPARTPAFSFTKPAPPPAAPPARPQIKTAASSSAFSFSSFGGPSATPAPASTPIPAPQPLTKPAADIPTPTSTFASTPPASTSQPSFFGAKKVTFAPTPEPTPPPPAASISSPAPSFSFTSTPTPKAAPAESAVSAKSAEPSSSSIPSFFGRKPTAVEETPGTAPTPAPVVPLSTPQPASVPSSTGVKPSSPAPRRVSSMSESQRRAQRDALPALRDKLIAEVIADKLAGVDAELRTVVKQNRAARAYAEAKARRQEAIAKYAQQTFDRLFDAIVSEVSRDAHLAELWRRTKLRSVARHWRRWAVRQREDRNVATLEREEAFKRLGEMGLGSSSIAHRDSSDLGPSSSLRHSHSHLESDRLDPFAADVLLHQTERSKNHFYSAGTFLATTARYVAPLLQPPTPVSSTFTFQSTETPSGASTPSSFRTLLSPARDSATPPSDTAFKWLRSKVFPDHDEPYTQDGITFDAEVMGRYDGLTQCESLGLLVFEAPLTTWSSEKRRSNAADAQDRLKQLSQIASNQANEYTPPLLLVSWEDETLEEVTERLGIRDHLTSFAHSAILSLESADDLDARFASVLDALLAESPLRQKVVIDLQDAANRLYPSWERFLATLRATLPSSGSDAVAVSTSFKLGVAAINSLTKTVKSALGDVEICETSTFDPPTLPDFAYSPSPTAKESITDAAEAIAGYISDDSFAALSDVSLFTAPLRQAVFHGHALPIDSILQSLATMILSEIAGEKLPLRAFYRTQMEVQDFTTAYLRRIGSDYVHVVDDCITKLGAASPGPKTPSPAKSGNTLKRSHSKVSLAAHDENRSPTARRASETKAQKNAKLLKALRDVEQTLGSLEVEEQRVDYLGIA